MKSTPVLASFESSQTVRRSWPRRGCGAAPAKMESLEDRALFSVAPLGGGLALPVTRQLPAVQAPVGAGGTQGIIAVLIGL